jgi:phenylalanyl-tRNA synthetase alpha chain
VRLSSQAIRVLEKLKQDDKKSVTDFEREGFDQATVNRALLELKEEKLVETEEQEEIIQNITQKGERVLEEGSPEYNILQQLSQGITPISDLEGKNTNVGVGKAKQRGWIQIDNGKVSKTDKGEKVDLDPLKDKLEQEKFDDELEERGLTASQPQTTKTLKLTEKGRETSLENIKEDFNVEARTETPRTGKKHFYKDILDFSRQKFIEMGFQEMQGDFVVPSFLNFDALYTPQDHPARELHDTFFVEKPAKTDLSEYGEKVEHVKETHENGWTTGGKGYGSEWSKKEAAKNVLRTHTTAVSARRLHEIDIKQEELPKKLFIIGRNFRNETVDRTHLPGFIQLDGIVVGENLNYTHLKGYLNEFFQKMGYDEFRLIPSYYPYTEMSTEVQVWDEEDQEWLGLGGAGLFRPEVVKPMLGFEATVLAWGLGVGRIAMKAAQIDDIRELYRNDIQILENTPKWRPE